MYVVYVLAMGRMPSWRAVLMCVLVAHIHDGRSVCSLPVSMSKLGYLIEIKKSSRLLRLRTRRVCLSKCAHRGLVSQYRQNREIERRCVVLILIQSMSKCRSLVIMSMFTFSDTTRERCNLYMCVCTPKNWLLYYSN